MESVSDFELMFSRGYSLVTVNIIYYMPDHHSLVNEFMWQTLDLKPKYPRVERFLEYWRKEIDAIIKEVQLCDSTGLAPRNFKRVVEINTRFQ